MKKINKANLIFTLVLLVFTTITTIVVFIEMYGLEIPVTLSYCTHTAFVMIWLSALFSFISNFTDDFGDYKSLSCGLLGLTLSSVTVAYIVSIFDRIPEFLWKLSVLVVELFS